MILPQYQTACLPQHFEATLAASHDLTHDIRELRFKLKTPVPFLPGQYALLLSGARDICGEELIQALPGYGERFFFHPIIPPS